MITWIGLRFDNWDGSYGNGNAIYWLWIGILDGFKISWA
jgi:hypothetical protein